MVPRNDFDSMTRRGFVRVSTLAASAAVMGAKASASSEVARSRPHPPPLLTPAESFYDVSRGKPKPHTLTGDALIQARLTPETWRMEIVADPFNSDQVKEPASVGRQFSLTDGTAIDLPMLVELGRQHAVRYLKAMQCLNIPEPLGQGLWEGVPLREVLRLCGPLRNVRRVYYWGYHNNDPGQMFQSSLSYSEVMETPPGDPPVFIAYRLNGGPIPLARGGPVRMVVPWAHGFKSIKWLHYLALTNDFRANDTYANQNNDPDSPLKTAAYIDKAADKFGAGETVFMTGRVIAGWSGLQRVEYWLRRVEKDSPAVSEGDEVFRKGPWKSCELEAPPPDWSTILPEGVSSKEVLGFDAQSGRPQTWPLRYSMISWSAELRELKPGRYEFRARAVDLNGFAQPEPRPVLKAGKNAVEVHRFEVV